MIEGKRRGHKHFQCAARNVFRLFQPASPGLLCRRREVSMKLPRAGHDTLVRNMPAFCQRRSITAGVMATCHIAWQTFAQ